MSSSAATELAVGDKIILRLQLFDGATDQFVRAYVCDSDGTNLGTYDLTHKINGLYTYSNPLLVFPNYDGEVYASYEVFSDAGYTVRNKKHNFTFDIYRQAVSDETSDNSEIIDLLNQILTISSKVEACEIVAEISVDDDCVTGLVSDDKLVGQLITEDKLVGQLTETTLKADIIENDIIEGILDESPNT